MLCRPKVYFTALRNAFCRFLSARYSDRFAVLDDLLLLRVNWNVFRF
jgi:hypothetical protein